ncbi:MAG: LptE family protein [Bacteroidota bacterium]
MKTILSTVDCRLSTIISLLLFASLSGCGVYSFTGAALGSEIRTISIDNFYNDAGNGPPNMSQIFTEEIRDYYQANTNLALVPENGDLLLEGSITRYEFVPVAPQASGSNDVADVAGLVRLNITVSASYVNTYSDEFNFENKSFTFFADFSADRDPSSVEEELIEEIFDQIIFDIFAGTVANW